MCVWEGYEREEWRVCVHVCASMCKCVYVSMSEHVWKAMREESD